MNSGATPSDLINVIITNELIFGMAGEVYVSHDICHNNKLAP